jgi:leucyl aminopeptidase
MKFQFKKLTKPGKGVVVLPMFEGKAEAMIKATGIDKSIIDAIKANKKFTGKLGQVTTIFAAAGTEAIVVLGLGKASDLDEVKLQQAGGALASQLNAIEASKAELIIAEGATKKLSHSDIAVNICIGVKSKNYAFNKYFVDKADKHKLYLKELSVAMSAENTETSKAFAEQEQVLDGMMLTRDLVSEPSNVLFPEEFMNRCKQLKKLGISIKVLKEKDMEKLGMNALLGVGQGSEKDSYTVIMEYNGGPKKKDAQPIAFVGKGVCFDTGGISIKPSANMGDMKYDMGGAGVVTGLMYALAARKAKVNVIGAIGLVENMPSGSAQKPGDVVKSMSGQTIEVDNTDAEGRLVLADVLWYVQEKYDPSMIIDLATLTGACVIALGDGNAGLFANDDTLADNMITSGLKVGEGLWRLPVSEHYDEQINSDIADIKNVGQGRGAGATTAAQFLQRFIQKGRKWAHIDIAGMAWAAKGTKVCPKGASGFGVRTLDRLVKEHYE